MLDALLLAELGALLEHEGKVLEVLNHHGNRLLIECSHFDYVS